MKVRVIRDTYDYAAGVVVDMPQPQAEAWIHVQLAEPYEERAKPVPQNKAKKPSRNKAKRKRKTK